MITQKNFKNGLKFFSLCFGAVAGIRLINHEKLKASGKDSGTIDILLSVHMMVRHGARTPMSLVHDLGEVIWFKTIINIIL